MAETELDMVHRHIREGALRIERQRALVAELYNDGHVMVAARAEALLDDFQAIQREAEIHLKRLTDRGSP